MAYFRLIVHEFWVVVKYAIFPTIINLLLTYIRWNYITVMSIIKLFIFVRLVHNEDQRTGSLHFKYLFVKLAMAVTLYYLSYFAAAAIQERYLPDNLLSQNPSNTVSDGHTKVKVPKSIAKTMLLTQKSRSTASKAAYFGYRVLAEYLIMCNSVAQYRIVFLISIFMIYGTIQLIIWYYLPEKKKDDDEDGSSNSSDSDDINNSITSFDPETE